MASASSAERLSREDGLELVEDSRSEARRRSAVSFETLSLLAGG